MALRSTNRPQSKFQRYGPDFVALLKNELELAPNDLNRQTTLHNHQIEAVLKTKAWFERDWSGHPPKPALIVAPMGSGKTGIVTLLPYVLGCPNVIILSPCLVISKQLAKAFGKHKPEDTCYVQTNLMDAEMVKEYNENVNILSQTKEVHELTQARLLIINVHSVSGNLKMSLYNTNEIDNVREKFKYFTTIIVHEAHHYTPDSWASIIKIFKGIGKKIIFVTATQFSQGPVLGPDQEVTYEIRRQDIIGRFIRDMKFEEITEIRKDDTDRFNDNEFNILKQRILGYLKVHDEQVPEVTHKAIIRAFTEDASEHLATKLGEMATFVDEKDDGNLELFEKNGDRKILVVCGRLTERYDKSNISVCVILRAVLERTLFTQFIAQCQRLSMPGDPVQAVVLSAPGFQQKWIYSRVDTLREEGELL